MVAKRGWKSWSHSRSVAWPGLCMGGPCTVPQAPTRSPSGLTLNQSGLLGAGDPDSNRAPWVSAVSQTCHGQPQGDEETQKPGWVREQVALRIPFVRPKQAAVGPPRRDGDAAPTSVASRLQTGGWAVSAPFSQRETRPLHGANRHPDQSSYRASSPPTRESCVINALHLTYAF